VVSRSQKIRLGIFTAFAFTLLLLMVVALIGRLAFQKKNTYYIVYRDVSVNGLQVGGSVKYRGLNVGRVESITINPENVREIIVNISVEKETPIKKDMSAILVYVGITGLKQIELVGGSNEAEDLASGGEIPTGTSALESISGKAEVVAEKVEILLNELITLATQVREKNLIANINQSIIQLNQLIEENRWALNHTMQNIDTLTTNLNEFSVSLNVISSEIETLLISENLQATLANTRIFTESLNEVNVKALVDNMNQLVANANTAISHIDLTVLKGRGDLLSSLESLKESVDYLNEFTRMISENPALLLRGKQLPEVNE